MTGMRLSLTVSTRKLFDVFIPWVPSERKKERKKESLRHKWIFNCISMYYFDIERKKERKKASLKHKWIFNCISMYYFDIERKKERKKV